MIKYVIYIIMGILYAGMGVFALLNDWFLSELNPTAKIILAILFILYGLFRIFRAIKAIRTQDY